MSNDLRKLVIDLSNEIGIDSQILLEAVKESILSGKISEDDLVKIISKLVT